MEFGSGKKRSSNLFDYMVPQTFKSCEKGEIYLKGGHGSLKFFFCFWLNLDQTSPSWTVFHADFKYVIVSEIASVDKKILTSVI